MDHTLQPIQSPAAPLPLQSEPIDVREYRPRVALPVALFLFTCWSTWAAGSLSYAIAVMTILLAHEMGHYLQARRYRVPASLPYFIPMPGSPIGTMGAVIGMQPGIGNRRSLFDIGVSGPLAGLVPTMIFSIVGIYWSTFEPIAAHPFVMRLGEPLLFKALAYSIHGPAPIGYELALHPVAFAGWVGMFITALNLIPIGQLDGGHVLYALLREKAHGIAQALLILAMVGVVLYGYWGWSLMLLLLLLMGPIHPPTSDDSVELGTARTIIGWLSLAFVPLGFTPVPFQFPM
jgi:membrane-associated protease RseP (regulator of RpoE activity)